MKCEECERMLKDSISRESICAPEDKEVCELCERIGYGAVMDSAARLWRLKNSSGAFVVGPCIGTLVHNVTPDRTADKVCRGWLTKIRR